MAFPFLPFSETNNFSTVKLNTKIVRYLQIFNTQNWVLFELSASGLF